MRVVIVEPGKQPRLEDVKLELEALQAIVGGHIEAVHPFEDPVVLVCNEEGRLLDLEPNRTAGDFGMIYGPFFLCGHSIDDFASLPEELAEKYMECYKLREEVEF